MSVLLEGMKLRWFGHSSFYIQSPEGLKILVDPWLEHPKAPKGAKQSVIEEGVDLILLTHGHIDHIGNTIEIAKETGATVASIYEVMLFLASHGLEEENLVGMNKGGSYQNKDLKATMVDASHSSTIEWEGKMFPGGEAAGFMMRFKNGYTIYHTGDTGLFGGLEDLGTIFKPNLLLLPIGDLFTLGPELAAHFTKKINPQYVLPMHWGTFPVLTGTPKAFQKELGDRGDSMISMEPGDWLK